MYRYRWDGPRLWRQPSRSLSAVRGRVKMNPALFAAIAPVAAGLAPQPRCINDPFERRPFNASTTALILIHPFSRPIPTSPSPIDSARPLSFRPWSPHSTTVVLPQLRRGARRLPDSASAPGACTNTSVIGWTMFTPVFWAPTARAIIRCVCRIGSIWDIATKATGAATLMLCAPFRPP